ncbi:unnamed protein product [marine sediment metagenome]|uniref:ATP-dependent DNA ligase family profile domain-containing protein n=1 Tax=marine sediment metagenome TaxID=412755 RepID=X1U382_9ZZZZ
MIKPMKCRDYPKPFSDPNYIWEPKYDGARILAQVNGTGYQLRARSGSDKTKQFPELEFKTRSPCILDGEVVWAGDPEGMHFSYIQRRINRQNNIQQVQENFPGVFEVFDIIEEDMNGIGINLRRVPLGERKTILENILIPSSNVLLAPYYSNGQQLFDMAKENEREGIIGKYLNAGYSEGKREWLKVKVWQEGDFLVVGYTEGTGWRVSTFGALILSDLKGNHVGAVGTGDLMIGKENSDVKP